MVDKSCIFCKIANNEISSKKIYEDDNVVAFLDIHPISDGHTIVINKTHSNNLSLSNNKQLNDMIIAMNKVANILIDKLNVNNFNYLSSQGKIAGQEIDHWHFHIIPKYQINKGFIVDNKISIENIDEIYKKIKE